MNPKPPRGGSHPAVLILVALAFAGAGALSAGYWLRPQPLELAVAKLYPEPRELADFELTDGDGDRFGLDRWRGRWDLVFFGFTYCPDVCPNTLNELKAIDAELRDAGHDPPRITFVSVDPERDTPARLKSYVGYFNPEFQVATGDHGQLEALTRQLGMIYRIEAHEPGARGYAVDHSASLLLIDPQARLRAVFPAPHEVGGIVADLAKLSRG